MQPCMVTLGAVAPRAGQWVAVVAVALGLGLVARPHAQPAPQQAGAGDPGSDFRAGVTLVRTDVIVRDANGAFIADLAPDDFIVEEDGVPQELASLVLVNGGRVYNQLIPPPPPAREGIVLPTTQGVGQVAAGRVIILFVDELHFRASHTPEVRRLIKTIGDVLIHEGDLFGVVGNGTSGVAVDLTYDRTRLTAAANEVLGVGFSPRELVYDLQAGIRGPEEIRWRSHQAFKTVYDLLVNLESVRDRRKVLVYISTGYDLNPLALERLTRSHQVGLSFSQDLAPRGDSAIASGIGDRLESPIARVQAQGAVFADGELIGELAELTRAANRANTTFYTVDPRGMMAAPEIDFNVREEEWAEYQRTTRNSLRTLADLTGGLSIVNTNNFDGLLKRIDAESSDYYVLGFYASNPDPTARTRQLRLSVTREGATVQARTSYELGDIVSESTNRNEGGTGR